jgi:ArsR family transcriptional regulator
MFCMWRIRGGSASLLVASPSGCSAATFRGALHLPRNDNGMALDATGYFHHSGDMEKLTAVGALAALAQESRLDIFRLLVQAGTRGLPVGQIGERLGGMPSATLSFHLNQLRQAGLVTFHREGRSLVYAAQYAAMNGLMAYLTENCCRGNSAGCGVGVCDGSALATVEDGRARQ